MQTKVKVLLWLVLCCQLAYAQVPQPSILEYIETYKWLAVIEMEKSGIPASIKLAQGILETRFGTSELVRQSNNHFGIKCKKEWNGSTYYHPDDCKDRSNRKIPCCFRVYSDAEASYANHSRFLKSRSRYGVLFSLPRTDYQGWAKGLKKAGYATAKNYDQALIRIIENHNLHVLDTMTYEKLALWEFEKFDDIFIETVQRLPVASTAPVIKVPEQDFATLAVPVKASFFPRWRTQEIFYNNSLKTIAAQNWETAAEIAERSNLPLKKLLKFNELEGRRIVRGQYIYLEKKKKQAAKGTNFHQIAGDETLYDIAQLYGIRLKVLYKKNRMKKGEPLKGAFVLLGSGSLEKAPEHRLE